MRNRLYRCALGIATLLVCAGMYAQDDRDTFGVPATSVHAPAESARLDINHADADELMKIPGMKRTWAERIVRYRPYRSKQDLLDRGIVPPEVYDRIKDYVIAHRTRK